MPKHHSNATASRTKDDDTKMVAFNTDADAFDRAGVGNIDRA